MTSTVDPTGPDFIVVIGDIVKSRELSDRAAAQETLREAVATFNQGVGDLLAAPLEVTGGDEMKTILEEPGAAVDVVTRISDAMHPIALAWGIGRGPIETSWVPDVGALDGPCFYRARQAVQAASGEEVWGRAEGFSPLDDHVMSALLRLIGALRASWTQSQAASVRAVRNGSQKEAARELGLTQSGISKSLGRARYHDVTEGESALRDLLAAYRDPPDGAGRSARTGGRPR